MPISIRDKSELNPAMIAAHFLGDFEGKLRVATFAADLPFAGNLAPMQSAVMFKGDALSIEQVLEKGANDLANSVSSIAEAAGATHISFEKLESPFYAVGYESGWQISTDARTGVSIRLSWLYDQNGERLQRFDTCYRLWRILQGEPQ